MSQKKQIFKLSLLQKLVADENSCVSLVQSTRLLALPPIFLNDMKSGIFYQLNSLLKKYDRSLGGIVIGYQNIKVLMDENTGIIPMGAPETEVNISVEFYIFQPKIGSYLEGVVNKKSNTHIGCLVHQYFNATILKSEDVYYEDWICKDLNVDDKIVFRVKDLDFTTLLPYIEGIYDGSIVLGQTHTKTNMNCDTDNLIAVNKSHCYKVSLLSEFSRDKTIVDKDENDCISSKQNNNQNEKEVNPYNISKSNEFVKDKSIEETKKKKKKKKKEKVELLATFDDNVCFKENSSNDKKVMSSRSDINLFKTETPEKKKKNRKKREEDANESVIETEKKEARCYLPWNIYNKPIEVEDENSNDFVKGSRSKKNRKKKKNENEISPDSNKISECLLAQEIDDNVLCSTQLGTTLGANKMKISFCSPIPQTITSEVKANYKKRTGKSLLNHESLSETEVKKKNKKRKREKLEEESEDSPATKKTKTSNTFFSSSKVEDTETKENGNGEKSFVQSMMEELYKQQLNRVREELNMSSSDKESFSEKRKKDVRKEKKADRKKSLNVPNTMTSQMDEENNSEVKSLLKRLLNEELQRVKEQLGMSDKDSFKSKKSNVKTKKQERSFVKDQVEAFKNKEIISAQINGTKEPEKITNLENLTKNFTKQRLNVGTEESSTVETYSGKEKNKKKSVTTKHETSKEKNQNSLYDKLLSEAKSVVLLDQNNATNVLQTMKPKEKKKDELPDFSENYSKKKDSQKKNREKNQNLKETENFKNGSMYDVAPTPEKRNPDKSLFSDSEHSHLSPVKRPKEINSKPGKSMVQTLMDDFYKEEIKKLKSESDRESVKDAEKKLKKQKKMKKSETQNVEVESLYEKLLREARSLVANREESTPIKKESKMRESKTKN